MFGKCYPSSQLRQQKYKSRMRSITGSQITCFRTSTFKNAHWQSINTNNSFSIECVKCNCLMKTKFWLASPCWKDYRQYKCCVFIDFEYVRINQACFIHRHFLCALRCLTIIVGQDAIRILILISFIQIMNSNNFLLVQMYDCVFDWNFMKFKAIKYLLKLKFLKILIEKGVTETDPFQKRSESFT